MAKKIRQVKLTEEDIVKNSGKDISHSIKKQKKQEKIYTFVLVVMFIVLIPVFVFMAFKVDSSQLFDSSYYRNSNISMSGQFITLNNKSILSDEDALKKNPYIVKYNNITTNNINFIIHFAKDEKAILTCNCKSKLLDYHSIKYSLDGKTVHQFSDETMIISANRIKALEKDQLKIWIWIDDSVDSKKDNMFLGKIVFEELEDMDV